MITLVVPTFNRAHTLRRVAQSYFEQDELSELVFVSDAGTDDTPELITDLARRHPAKRVLLLTTPQHSGASHSRNVGAAVSSNEFILFCDDDEYLEAGYAATLLRKLIELDAAAISGRRIYLREGETAAAALRRFGEGLRQSRPFHPLICEYVNGARFSGDLALPLTNANILTRRSLLLRFPFDSHYSRGNGYREESDFQMNLFVHGYDVYVSNACHSFHLPLSEVRSGGQRTAAWRRIGWSVRYTNYFYGKYYDRYAQRVGLHAPRLVALGAFAAFSAYRETLRPHLHRAALAMRSWRDAANEPAPSADAGNQ